MHPSGEVPDDVWCSIVARRAAARACLHLGITSTSEEALDTLAEALLAYLERIAGTLANAVEASKRPTANVLDVLNVAVPLCTSAAVQRVFYNHGGGGAEGATASAASGDGISATTGGVSGRHASSSSSSSFDPTQDMSWKGLAAFMFGPDWDRPFTTEEASEAMARYQMGAAGPGGAAGGKVGPSSVADAANPFAATSAKGWCAPYPDKLPAFPTSKRKAAPSMGLYDDDENEASDTEDQEPGDSGAVPYEWLAPSITDGESKRRHDSVDENAMDISPSKDKKAPKRVRISEHPATAAAHDEDGDSDGRERERLYLPRFLPPFPAHRDGVRPVLEASTPVSGAESEAVSALDGTDDEPGLRVRSALVSLQPDRPLGSGLSSSGWDGTTNTQTPLLSVPWGRPTSGIVSGGNAAAGAGGAAVSSGAAPSPSAAAAAQIVPLGRPSGSRVSRILEGSMDGP